tara:strand:- start:103 stop:321 length:219 start_codon:yes stop_codon:yes gene_type:complete
VEAVPRAVAEALVATRLPHKHTTDHDDFTYVENDWCFECDEATALLIRAVREDDATPSRRRRVDGVDVDAII